MLCHEQTWLAIDKIAARENMSCAGLAARVGLDPTLFNKSKRFTREGKPRLPSFNTILKLLAGTNMTLCDFEILMHCNDKMSNKCQQNPKKQNK